MTYRQCNTSSKDRYSKPRSRLNQEIRRESTDEGCPVMQESGTVCGETNNLNIFQEFRQLYDDCLKKLEESKDGNSILRRLAPFKKLIDDLWEQNTMLVETVEELEQEATCRVSSLQDKLNNSCQKECEYQEDIKTLISIIQKLCENDIYDPSGLTFNTLCPALVFGKCRNSCSVIEEEDEAFNDQSEICKKPPNLKSVKLQAKYETIPKKNKTQKSDSYLQSQLSKRLSANRKNATKKLLLDLKCDTLANRENSCLAEDQKSLSLKNNSPCNEDFFSINDECSCECIDKTKKCEFSPLDENDCHRSIPSVNINFNLGNSSSLDCSGSCCNCSCTMENEDS